MTNSALAEPTATLRGDQRPRILAVPPAASTAAGTEAVELAASVGLVLDPWQAFTLECALGETADGRWSAFETGLLVSRQNGKGALLEAVELAGLFLFDERLILHSAHEYKTAAEGFRRVLGLVESYDHLRRRVKQVRTSHGEEGIELRGGQRLRFIARSTGSGRGFSGDRVILDEAQHLGDDAVEALLPTMSARPNPQLWYTATAADRDLAPCGPLARLRKRGLRGGDPGLCYLEWSIDPHTEFCPAGCGAHDDPASIRSWLKANPGAGIRIPVEHMAREFASLGERGFARERLGVGNWPTEADAWQVIAEDAWRAVADPESQLPDPVRVAIAADVTPGQTFGSIAVAGRRADGLGHVEVVEHRPRTGWMVERILQLASDWKPVALVVDGAGQAGSLIAPLEAAGVEVVKPTAREAAQACGAFYEAVVDTRALRHRGQPMLVAALAGAKQRALGDAWAWDRKGAAVDLCPLVAVTLAAWGFATRGHLGAETTPEPDIF